MNQFGKLLNVSIFGESHGAGVGITIAGIPAGLPLCANDFLYDLERRKGGMQKGTTPRKEDDFPIFKTGIFRGRSTGAPLTIWFENKNTRSGDYAKQRDFPRPGHADFVAHQKYGGFEDFRGGGHFSGRLTVALVAAGVVAKRLMTSVKITATITQIGGETDIEAGLQKAIDQKDSVGGIVECTVTGLPAGLGEPFFSSIESILAQAVFAIPAIKGIEFGAGFAGATMFGVQHNDAIIDAEGNTATNNAGGVVGGITNGNPLVFRVVVKPTSSTPKDQETLNWNTGAIETFSVKGRHDLCIALRVPPVLEAVTAFVLADFMLQQQHIPRIWPKYIYHITTTKQWQDAEELGRYEHPSLQKEQFIHTSDYHQVADTLQRVFSGEEGLAVLKIDVAKLNKPPIYEAPPYNEDQLFPHIYSAIPLQAIVDVLPASTFL